MAKFVSLGQEWRFSASEPRAACGWFGSLHSAPVARSGAVRSHQSAVSFGLAASGTGHAGLSVVSQFTVASRRHHRSARVFRSNTPTQTVPGAIPRRRATFRGNTPTQGHECWGNTASTHARPPRGLVAIPPVLVPNVRVFRSYAPMTPTLRGRRCRRASFRGNTPTQGHRYVRWQYRQCWGTTASAQARPRQFSQYTRLLFSRFGVNTTAVAIPSCGPSGAPPRRRALSVATPRRRAPFRGDTPTQGQD